MQYSQSLIKTGLSSKEVEESKLKYGINKLSYAKKPSWFKLFIKSFSDIWIKILLGAFFIKVLLILISFFLHNSNNLNDVIELVSILSAILLSTIFGSISEFKNISRSIALEEEYNKTYSKVIRNSEIITILSSEIVKGDIVLFQAGDKILSDGVVISGSINVNQAALNGESDDVYKTEYLSDEFDYTDDYLNKHKVFMGSVVTSGEAYVRTTVVGDETEIGKINKSLIKTDNDRKDTSSLKLEKLAGQVAIIGVGAAVLTFIINIVFYFTSGTQDYSFIGIVTQIATGIMLMASIIIMAVPEGLPMMNVLVQTMNSENMYKKNILVKNKASFSDSAYINLLFTDKTGTVTEGNLSLVDFIQGDGKILKEFNNTEFYHSLILNNNAKLSKNTAIGSNNMDRALLNYASKKIDYNSVDWTLIKEKTGFDSNKKCFITTLNNGERLWKGAPEFIFDSITHYITPDGELYNFDEHCKNNLLSSIEVQSKRMMKMLSVCKIIGDKTILYSVLCLRDNIRKDAASTVQTLFDSGIQVVMVTGDAENTGKAIASESGIYKEGDLCLSHETLSDMSDEEVIKCLPKLRVVTRARPLDKKRLVSLAQNNSYVCGMTGDGVNDAPALKCADVGFAMGDGTAVAAEAGDVVILNNSLTSIKDCILNSRTMAKSVQKFIIFQLTVNIATLIINVLSPLLNFFEPFSIVQILWINLIMDTLAALAFGGEPVLEKYMKEKPVAKNASIITKYMKKSIVFASVFISIICLMILKNILGISSPFIKNCELQSDVYIKSMMFTFFIYAVIFNSFNTRSNTYNILEKIYLNKKFIIVMGLIFIMQTLILVLTPGIFGLVRISLKATLFCMSLGFLIIPLDLLRKVL